MTLNFEKYNYELFQNWQKNAVKNSFTTELKKRADEEKRLFPNYYQMAI